MSSDFYSAGDEGAKAVGIDASSSPQSNLDERAALANEEDEQLDADVTITSPMMYSNNLAEPIYGVDQTQLQTEEPVTHNPETLPSSSEELFEETPILEYEHVISAQTIDEPSIEQLLDDNDDAEEYICSHPWEDENIIETARRVSVMHTSLKRLSQRSRDSTSFEEEAQASTVPLSALFAPLPEPDLCPEGVDHQPAANLASVIHSSAPPSYTDQGVAADLADLNNDLAAQQKQEQLLSNSSHPDIYGMLEAFRVRLTEVEQKLDEMERREAQRLLAEEEEAKNRRDMAEASHTMVATVESDLPAQFPTPVGIVPVETWEVPRLEKVSIGISTNETEQIVVKKAASSKTKIPKVSRQPPPSEFMPDGLPQFIIGASIGVFVIVVQTLLKRYTGKRS